MHALSVRAKLMFFYFLVTFTGLLLFGLLSFGVLQYTLLQAKKTHLKGREDRLISLLEENKASAAPLSLEDELKNYALVTHEGNLFDIHNLDGSPIFPSKSIGRNWPLPKSEDCAHPVFRSVVLDPQPAMMMCHIILLDGRPVRLHIGGSLDEEVDILKKYRDALLLLLPGLLILSSISGYLLSGHALRPVGRMTRAALGIGIGNLSERLPVPPAKDEIQQLAIAWNQLLARLDAAVSRLSQFSADASHDLRTSITVILATAQLSLHRRRSEEEYREDLDKIVTECRTASTLLDALLALAQSDNFIHEVAFREINLCELLVSGCRRVEDLAESSGIMLDWHLPAESAYIQGDELLLQRLLGILLDNAIRYTPAHGEIRAEVTVVGDNAIVTVRDTGVGMSEDVRQHVFERFYQADLRERKSQAGSGLGLSIGRWIADAHGADLTVESAPGRGSAFRIRFPATSEIHLATTVHASR
ncbi:HAMP domain-containing sensor histidine kinase [Granulicella sp. L60]|uniref:sensor histidine kinase n=1 Tax=Granulicella sp. L60 TaxID=1641866 RepID=UPI00131D97B1|nr:ATP-binding protein [Granulicella sp. L60]